MTRCSVLTVLGLLTACQPTLNPNSTPSTTSSEPERFVFREQHLGTHAGLTFYARSEAVANRAAAAAYDRIRELDAVFSSYRQDSEIQQLCDDPQAAEGVQVSGDLWNVLTAANELSRKTNGAFDVTIGPVARLWKRAIRKKVAPDPTRLAQAMQSVGFELLKLNTSNQQVTLGRPKMQIDLAAIAKGYIADEVLAVLREHDCPAALVDLGGDLAIGDTPPEKDGWSVGIASGNTRSLSTKITLSNCSLATSGDAFQHFKIDGQRHSHIVDPRTGQATIKSLTVTVIAKTCLQADGLASSVSVLGEEAGLKLIEATADTEASILVGETATRLSTSGFPKEQT